MIGDTITYHFQWGAATMKTSFFRTLSLLVIFFCLMVGSAYGNQSGYLPSVDIRTQLITVEDLGAEFHTESGSITVSAQIKNVSHSILRGYATIYYLSAEGQEIFSYQDEINGGEPFAHGTTIDFESTSQVTNIKKIATISVDFTKN